MRDGTGSLKACIERLSELEKRTWTPVEYRRKLVTDICFFKSELWFDRSLDLVAPLSEVEMDIANFAANGPRLRLIIGFRGIGKTYDASSLICYRGRRDRHRRMAIYSKSLDKVKETAGLVRQWLDVVWFLRDLAPDRTSRDKITAFDFAGAKEDRAHSVSVLGMGGQLEGGRAHTIIPDDIETKANTTTVDAREDLDRKTAEFQHILYPDVPHSRGGPVDPVEVVGLGTYKHEESVYLKLANRGYVLRSFPIVYPSPGDNVRNLSPVLARKLESDPSLADKPTVPLRFNDDEVAERRSVGKHEFDMELKLVCDLASSNRYPLRLSDFIVMPLHRDKAPLTVGWGQSDHNGSTVLQDPPCVGFAGDRLHRPIFIDKDWTDYNGTKVWIDPAGRGADWTAACAVAQVNGLLFWKGVMGLEGGSSAEDMTALILFCRRHNARDIYIESNADTLDTYRQLFETELRKHFLEPGENPEFPNGWKATVIQDTKITHSTGQKEIRIIEVLEPILSTHRMVADPECLRPVEGEDEHLSFQYQLSRLTKDRKCLKEDAKIDALAGACRAWNYALGIDPEKAAARKRERQHEETAKKLKALTSYGNQPQNTNFIARRRR